MILPKPTNNPLDIVTLNLAVRKVCESLLARQLTKIELTSIFHKIKLMLKQETDS